jgi:hypothetical protein
MNSLSGVLLKLSVGYGGLRKYFFSARGGGHPRYRKESYRSEKNKASVRVTTPPFLW